MYGRTQIAVGNIEIADVTMVDWYTYNPLVNAQTFGDTPVAISSFSDVSSVGVINIKNTTSTNNVYISAFSAQETVILEPSTLILLGATAAKVEVAGKNSVCFMNKNFIFRLTSRQERV